MKDRNKENPIIAYIGHYACPAHDFHSGRSHGWRLTPSEVAQALRSAAASGSYIAEPIRIRANETLSHV